MRLLTTAEHDAAGNPWRNDWQKLMVAKWLATKPKPEPVQLKKPKGKFNAPAWGHSWGCRPKEAAAGKFYDDDNY